MHLLLLLINLIILKCYKTNVEDDIEFLTGNEYKSSLLRIYGETNKMNLYKFFIPLDTSTVIFNFDVVFVSNCHLLTICSEYEVIILLQYGSYPFTTINDQRKPEKLFGNAKKQYMLKVDSNQEKNTSLVVRSPDFGYWFASVRVQNKLINRKTVDFKETHYSYNVYTAASMLYAKEDVVLLSDNQVYLEKVNSTKTYHFKLFVDDTNEFAQLKIKTSLLCAFCKVKICISINKLANLTNCMYNYTFDWVSQKLEIFRFNFIKQTWIYIRVETIKVDDSELDTDFSFELKASKTNSFWINNKTRKFHPFEFLSLTRVETINTVFFYDKKTKSTTCLEMEPLSTYILKFYLHEILDTEKTLIVKLIFMTPNKKNVMINGCLSSNIIAYPTKQSLCVNEEDNISNSNIGLRNESENYEQVLYPNSGWWYLSLRNYGDISNRILIDIRLNWCLVDSCHPNGFCNDYMSNNLHYFTCSCHKGFSGLDCKQFKSKEKDNESTLAMGLLTLSNLCFIPSIVLAFKKQLLAESAVYFFTMIISFIYHLCDTDRKHCIVALSVVQTCDFYCGLLSIWVTIIAISKVPAQTKSFLHIIGSIFLVFGVDYDKHSFWVFLVPFFIGLLIIFANLVYFYKKNKKIMFDEGYLLYNLPTGIVLAFIGLSSFAFVQSTENYPYVHSLWHLLMAFSILFFL